MEAIGDAFGGATLIAGAALVVINAVALYARYEHDRRIEAWLWRKLGWVVDFLTIGKTSGRNEP